DTSTCGPGRGGPIRVDAGSVEIGTFGQIGAGSLLGGDAGPIDVEARDSIHISNDGGPRFVLGDALKNAFHGGKLTVSGVFSPTVGGGAGGSIRLHAPEITLTDGAIVSTATINGGRAGS